MSKYFSEEEMKCHCCGGLPENGIDPKLYELLDMIRVAVLKPVIVNCAYRCPSHNAEVGGVPNSQHIDGTGADISVDGVDEETVAQTAENCLAEMGIEGGVGRYPSQLFTHVDTRGYTARWEG